VAAKRALNAESEAAMRGFNMALWRPAGQAAASPDQRKMLDRVASYRHCRSCEFATMRVAVPLGAAILRSGRISWLVAGPAAYAGFTQPSNAKTAPQGSSHEGPWPGLLDLHSWRIYPIPLPP
jgi:hypothetical protein